MTKPGSFFRLSALIIAVLVILLPGSMKNAYADQVVSGKITAIGSVEHDWGFIDIYGGDLQHTFTLRNTGEQNLILKGAFTSCGCTEAKIILSDGSVSPDFGMSLVSDWIGIVKPGENFDVMVNFDPLTHGPDALGPVVRKIYVISSAPPDGSLSTKMPVIRDGTVTTMRVSGDIVSSDVFRNRGRQRNYMHKMGDFRFFEQEHDLGLLKQSQGIVKYEFPFVYDGTEPVTITGTPASCGCTAASVSKKTLKPGEEGVLKVEFDPNFHGEPGGKFFRTISILTDLPQTERVEVRVWVEIEKDLGDDAYKVKEHQE